MTKILSSYSFLPWLRLGISNQIQSDDNADDVKLRAPITVNLDIMADGEKVTPPISQPVGLYGPGDIVGIDKKNIIKTEPRNWITNFEPNYLASIDFYEEDFPWRYTPARPDTNDRLRPWLTLVVLKEGEFENGKNIADRPLSYIEIKDETGKLFPPAEQLWAWAHVHVNADLIEDDIPNEADPDNPLQRVIADMTDETMVSNIKKEYDKVLKSDPDKAYSRIICPRRLEENTAYHAFLIPSFESGRLAGLGLDVEGIFDATDELIATSSAWGNYTDRPDSNYYPVYHRWYFRTGTVGDFEYLVRLLEPKPVDNRVGRRDMDVRNPGSNIDGISDDPEGGVKVSQLEGILRLGGALQVPVDSMLPDEKKEYDKYNDWAKPYPRTFQKQLAAFINLADSFNSETVKTSLQDADLPEDVRALATEDDDPDPIITAPLYGRWHSLTNRLLDPTDGKPDNNWVHELNLDPRFRVAAGFGTSVVQKNQENYMEGAWEQVGEVIEANRQIRQGQLAQVVSQNWYAKNVASMRNSNPGALLWLTQPVQARVLAKGLTLEGKEEVLTVHHHVQTSQVPMAAFSPEVRRFTRPRGRLTRSLGLKTAELTETALIDRINKREIKPAPDKVVPTEVPTLNRLSDSLKPQKAPKFLVSWAEKVKWLKYLFLGIGLLILALLAIFVTPNIATIAVSLKSISGIAMLLALLCIYLFILLNKLGKQVDIANSIKAENQTPDSVDELPKLSNFRLTTFGEKVEFKKGASDSAEAVRFKKALKDINELIQDNVKTSVEIDKPELNLSQIIDSTLEVINPKVSIPKYVLGDRIMIPQRLRMEYLKEVFKEAMAYPEFDIPMYKHLIDISPDLFLPNIDLISQNSISLLETNQKFIESYMVGLNHEFARELLWREYPTDQRGSYFRQFWDVSDFMFEQEEIDTMVSEIRSDLGEDADDETVEKKLQETIKEKLKDIPKLHLWSKYSKLEDHDNREKPGESGNEVVLVIRGELLKKYPNAVIYAHRAKWKPEDGSETVPDKARERELVTLDPEMEENPPSHTVKTPLYEAKADPDIYFFGFDLDVTEAQGLMEGDPTSLEDRAGWFFIIKERPGEPRFGLDIGETEAGELEVWNDMSWGNVTPEVSSSSADKRFLQVTDETETINVADNPLEDNDDEKLAQRDEDVQFTWNKDMNSAELAYLLFQAPVMVAVHGAEMLPKKTS